MKSNNELRILNQDYFGTEWCPECNHETDFNYNPFKCNGTIVCKHCGEEIRPCSLCDHDLDCGNCYKSIIASIIGYNKLQVEV